MTKAKQKLMVIIPVFLLFLILSSITIYAWYSVDYDLGPTFSATSTIHYFERGRGTELNPYIISNKEQMHNLAWLQNLGHFGEEKYYFVLENDIDMEEMILPPIGTEQYPFYGDFNGNNKTISNLVISNNRQDVPKGINISKISLGSKIGFFGVIGYMNQTSDNATFGKAYDFYLDNIKIINGANLSKIGIIVGENRGNIEKIGVSNASIFIKAGINASSENILIGKLGSKQSSTLIDYVMRIDHLFPTFDDEYVVSNTLLSFDGKASHDGYLYVNKTTYDNITKVYYFSEITSIPFIEKATSPVDSSIAPEAFLDDIFK